MRPQVARRAAGEQWRLAHDVDNSGRGRQEELHEAEEGGLDVLNPAAEQLACALFLEALEGGHVGAKDVFIDGLDEVVMKLGAVLVFFQPVVRARLCVDAKTSL